MARRWLAVCLALGCAAALAQPGESAGGAATARASHAQARAQEAAPARARLATPPRQSHRTHRVRRARSAEPAPVRPAADPAVKAAHGAARVGDVVGRGTASWYGPRLHGRRTASGERYDMHALTAAHPSLPFGTVLSVRSLLNDREVRVRVNDRGPHTRGRIIDLSREAALALGLVQSGRGTKPVLLTVAELPGQSEAAPPPAPSTIAAGEGAADAAPAQETAP